MPNPSRLAVLLFTDIVDSTELKTRRGSAAYTRLLERHNALPVPPQATRASSADDLISAGTERRQRCPPSATCRRSRYAARAAYHYVRRDRRDRGKSISNGKVVRCGFCGRR